MEAHANDHSQLKLHEQCDHCNEPVITPFKNKEGQYFCCSGCMQVFAIIHHYQLDYFYTIQQETGDYTKSQKSQHNYQFDYLDNEEVIKRYTKSTEQGFEVSFYLEGIHCLACLWLIEQTPIFSADITTARLNIEKSVVTLKLVPNSSVAQAAILLNQLGYRPFPIENEQEIKGLKRAEERASLIRIGIALACSMNIMLYSLGVYAGASSSYSNIFNYLSLILIIPVITYCAWPFYHSAYYALKNKHINLDVPLSFSILTGFTLSSYHVLAGSNVHYFDSISILIFLILLSRYALKKVQQNSLNSTDLSAVFGLSNALKVSSKDLEKAANNEEVELNSIKQHDLLLVQPGQKIPCDGVIVTGESRFNTSLINGESNLANIALGQNVLQGHINHDHSVIIKCLKTVQDSDLSQMLLSAQNELKNKPSLLLITDKISQTFIKFVFVFFFVTLTVGSYFIGFHESLQRALALVIVACPCALGLATPLAFSRALKKASRLGIMIKNEEVIERLDKVHAIYFDKTGTLTEGNFQVTSFECHQKATIGYSIQDIIFSLEKNNIHPIARTILGYLEDGQKQLKEIIWQKPVVQTIEGLYGHYQGERYSISARATSNQQLVLDVKENDTLLGSITLADDLRDSTQATTKWLFSRHYNLNILSGDQQTRVDTIVNKIGPYFTKALGRLTAHDKAQIIDHDPNSLMVGDGANDSLAFSKSSVSIAVQGALESSLKISDVYFSRQGLKPLKELIIIAKGTVQVIKRNLAISLIYNTLGAAAALGGFIGPLEAAILMPLSSFTVLISTIISNKPIRNLKEGL